MPTLVASNATGWPNIGSSQFFAIGPGLWVDIFFATELQDTTIRFTTNLALTPLRNEVFDGILLLRKTTDLDPETGLKSFI